MSSKCIPNKKSSSLVLVPGRFAPIPIRPLSRFAPIPFHPGSFRPYSPDKNKVPMNKLYNTQNTNICNGIFHISFFKALLINEGETTWGERE
jgi:hypothetical protein